MNSHPESREYWIQLWHKSYEDVKKGIENNIHLATVWCKNYCLQGAADWNDKELFKTIYNSMNKDEVDIEALKDVLNGNCLEVQEKNYNMINFVTLYLNENMKQEVIFKESKEEYYKDDNQDDYYDLLYDDEPVDEPSFFD